MKTHKNYILPDGRTVAIHGIRSGFFVAGIRHEDGKIEMLKSRHLEPALSRATAQNRLDVWAQGKHLKKLEVCE